MEARSITDNPVGPRRNAILAQKRKMKPAKKQDRKRRKIDKPRGRSIPYEAESQYEAIKHVSGCTEVFDPASGNYIFYSSLTHEPMCFCTYPILLFKPSRKGQLVSTQNTLPGTPRVELVFTVLAEAFKKLFPEQLDRFNDWEPVKWNTVYYGLGVSQRAPLIENVFDKNCELRSYGGDKNPSTVYWAHEATHPSKISLAVGNSEYIKNKPCLSIEDLKQLVAKSESFMNDTDLIKKSEMKNEIKEEYSESDDSDCSESE